MTNEYKYCDEFGWAGSLIMAFLLITLLAGGSILGWILGAVGL